MRLTVAFFSLLSILTRQIALTTRHGGHAVARINRELCYLDRYLLFSLLFLKETGG